MLEIVKDSIEFYLKYLKEPTLQDIKVSDQNALNQKWACFVTIYKNGEVRWSAGNIKEIEWSLAQEIIKNSIEAISKDKRFAPLTLAEARDIRIRLDIIQDRKILEEGKILWVDPMISGIIAIKRDYSKLATILPNISPKLMTGSDLLHMLEAKLEEKLEEKDYILYEIKTKTDRNY